MKLSTITLLLSSIITPTTSFITTTTSITRTRTIPHHLDDTSLFATSEDNDEARALLDKVAQIRAELAALEGKSITTVEAEAQQKKRDEDQRRKNNLLQSKSTTATKKTNVGARPSLPEDNESQIKQAADAVERAYDDGVVRQTVRFALVPEGDRMYDVQEWPGGAQQMSREAGVPLTRRLLKELRIAPRSTTVDGGGAVGPPTVTTRDIWDFDGSALLTAESSRHGPAGDVRAMVLANTDVKYTRDIRAVDDAAKDRLFFLVNPFWRDLDSWGVNLLSPGAKALAKEVIFERGYDETYCFHRFSVRGEICAALKAYPHKWQLFAYLEDRYAGWETPIYLGETEEEPGNKEFVEFLNEREEFKLSKNMRMMQRR